MDLKLFFQAIFKFLLGVFLVGLLIFIPAGTLTYFNGWLFMGVLFIPMFTAGIFMMVKDPNLLKRRLNAKEKQKDQSIIIKISALMFITGFIISGLDFKFCITNMHYSISIIASILLLFGYTLWGIVLKQNTYLSRTIEVEKGQKIIDKGLYSVVRHPMYLASLILFLMMPLVLGSIISFLVFLIYPILLIFRIKGEEKVLEKELEGYTEYKKKVKYRLIPFIW